MKQLILSVLLMCTLGLNNSMAQDIQRQGNTFVVTKSSTSANNAKKTPFTWQDSKGNKYPIYISKNGACFVKKVSKKTGKEYKQYLGKEISAQISKEMGIKYEPKK